MSEETVVASQSDESPTIEKDPITEALFSQFDLKPKSTKKEIKFPDANELLKVDPAIDQKLEEVPAEAKKSVKVKYNKEEIEIEEGKVPELLQKGLALDKERERKNELEKNLDRAAKLQGFKDHAEYAANLDRLEQQQQQKKQDDLDLMRKDLLDQLEANGIDREKAEAFIENHPLIKQSKEAIAKDAERSQQDAQAKTREQMNKSWQELYTRYPELVEDSEGFATGAEVKFFTPEMKSRIERGYDPVDAYELAHKDKLQTVNRKQAEQSAIKAQQLGTRAAATNGTAQIPDEPTLLPQQIALAQEFGVSVKGVIQHQKLLDSRRK